MTNEQKAKEISNDEYAEILSYNIGHPLICDNCGAIIYDRDTTDAAFRAAMKMAQWKDEQFNEQISILKDEIQSNLCASSGFNDEYSRGYQDCGMKVMEMIDKIIEV